MCECTVCNSWGGANECRKSAQLQDRFIGSFLLFFNYYFAFLETLSHRFKSLPRLHEDYENPPLSGKQPPHLGLDNSFKRPKENLVFNTNSRGCKQDMFCPRWSRRCSSVSTWQEFRDIDPEPVSTHTVSTVKIKQSSTIHVWSWTSHTVLSLWWCLLKHIGHPQGMRKACDWVAFPYNIELTDTFVTVKFLWHNYIINPVKSRIVLAVIQSINVFLFTYSLTEVS